MKPRLFHLPLFLFALLSFSTLSTGGQNLITFDDIPTGTLTNGLPMTIAIISNGYQGLNWGNFYVYYAGLDASRGGTNGSFYGMVSSPKVGFNGFGSPAEIDSAGTNFNFLSAYLTGAWNSNLNIEVEGFRSGALVYDKIVVAGATNATLFTFDYLDIDRLYFNSYGGQSAGFPGGGGNTFVMDNLTVEFIPEPSSFLLTAIAAAALLAFCKRKRR